MNPERSSFEQILQCKLEPEIYSFRVMTQFSESLKQAGLTRYPIHLKIDSGMHRLGFSENEIDSLIQQLHHQDTFQIRSIFSHLAGSDESQFDSFTLEQVELFEKLSSKIIAAFDYPIMRHILNSAGIERFPQFQYQMVRLGIGLYGISALDPSFVKEVSTLKTVILQIKDIPLHDTVGYSRKFRAERLTRIGVIPIGYADGLHRILGNGAGKVKVRGVLVPIVGNICMDMSMIDLTGIPAEEGDEVVIFGKENSILEISRQMQTIPYEVLTGISPRVKRIYFQE
jgi:alanine racemase